MSGVGSYALQALGGDRASTHRVCEDAAERPHGERGRAYDGAMAVVHGVPRRATAPRNGDR